MALRIRYLRTELSEGVVEVIEHLSNFEVMEDNTLKLIDDEGDVVGFVHPHRWESVLVVQNV